MNLSNEQQFLTDTPKKRLTESERLIFDIICNRIKLPSIAFSEADLQVDLIIKMKVPNNQEQYLRRREQLSLNQILVSPTHQMETAYLAAQQEIINEMNANSKQQLLYNQFQIRYYEKSKDWLQNSTVKKKKFIGNQFNLEEIQINCIEKISKKLTLFNLQYNMIMYALQSICGFRVKAYMMSKEEPSEEKSQPNQEKVKHQEKEKEIFLLLSLPIENVYALANQLQIKKEVDYSQIDFYCNDPVDTAERPLRYHSIQKENSQFVSQQKKINRRLKLNRLHWYHPIFDEVQIDQQMQSKFQQFSYSVNAQYDKIMNEPIVLKQSQKKFLSECNRNIVNEGVCSEFIRIKRFRKFHQSIRTLNQKYQYPIHNEEKAYHTFMLPAKRLDFFEKLRVMLRFKELVVGPEGQISHFLKMQRIKLAYLSLNQTFRLEYLSLLGCDIFALNDNFERLGETGDLNFGINKEVEGGLDGKNLNSAWKTVFPWRTDIEIIRNYYGEHLAYEILLKSNILTFFIIIMPFNLAGELITELLFRSYSSYYHLLSFTALLIAFNIFLSVFIEKENKFIQDFTQVNLLPSFRQNYQGPYIRNLVTDEMNEFTRQLTINNRLKNLITLLLATFILSIEGVFFYGIRYSIIELNSLSGVFPSSVILNISTSHLLMYCIYIWANYLIKKILLYRLFEKITELQNYSTVQAHQSSFSNKMFYYQIALEIIPLFFFMILEPFQRVSCYAIQCHTELIHYIHSRYLASFSMLFLKIIRVIPHFFSKKLAANQILERLNKSRVNSFQLKLNKLLQMVIKQSLEPEIKSDLTGEILAVMHFLLFTPIFPLSAIISLVGMSLDSMFQKLDMLSFGRRPIAKMHPLPLYSEKLQVILNISIIISCWSIFFTGEIVQYQWISFILLFQSRTKITQSQVFLVILSVIAFFALFYYALSALVRTITFSYIATEFKKRKNEKMTEYFLKKQSSERKESENTIELYPLKTIERVFNVSSNWKGLHSKNEDRNNTMDDLLNERITSRLKST